MHPAHALNYLEAILLGVVQGLTEFLPISSNAHVRIASAIAGWGDPGAAFTAVTQLGTELAVVLYFGRDIIRIAKAWLASLLSRRWPSDPDARMGWLVIFGSMPIVFLGVLLESPIDSGVSRSSADRRQSHRLRDHPRDRRPTWAQRPPA